MSKKKSPQCIVLDVVESVSLADTLLKQGSSEMVLQLQTGDSLSPYTVLPIRNGRRSDNALPKIIKTIPLSVKLPIKI